MIQFCSNQKVALLYCTYVSTAYAYPSLILTVHVHARDTQLNKLWLMIKFGVTASEG